MKDKEYIERDRIVKFIENGLNNPDKAEAFGHDAVEILAEIHLAPAADVVEVVRCKDCQHYIYGRCYVANRKPFSYDVNIHSRKGNDFCSYGERKEETP